MARLWENRVVAIAPSSARAGLLATLPAPGARSGNWSLLCLSLLGDARVAVVLSNLAFFAGGGVSVAG